eukprot:2500867-Prymnesium_polylepis.2
MYERSAIVSAASSCNIASRRAGSARCVVGVCCNTTRMQSRVAGYGYYQHAGRHGAPSGQAG